MDLVGSSPQDEPDGGLRSPLGLLWATSDLSSSSFFSKLPPLPSELQDAISIDQTRHSKKRWEAKKVKQEDKFERNMGEDEYDTLIWWNAWREWWRRWETKVLDPSWSEVRHMKVLILKEWYEKQGYEVPYWELKKKSRLVRWSKYSDARFQQVIASIADSDD